MALKGKEVLIVEELAKSRVHLRKVLETQGLTVTEAENVGRAFEIVKHRSPHLIILDLGLSGQNAFEFLKQKLITPSLSFIPVVVTGVQDKNDLYQALQLGAADYALNPVSSELLIRKVRRLLWDLDFLGHVVPEESKTTIQLSINSTATRLTESAALTAVDKHPASDGLVLIAEGDPAFAKQLEKMFLKAKLQVEVHPTLSKVKMRLQQGLPSLFIVDLNLEDSTHGLELIRLIRKEYSETVPIFVVPTVTELIGAAHAVEMGASDYIFRPLNRDAVMNKVNQFLTASKVSKAAAKVKGPTDLMLDFQLEEVDELGIKVFSKYLIAKGTTLSVVGSTAAEITGQASTTVLATLTYAEPDGRGFSAYLEFTEMNDITSKAVRAWIVQQNAKSVFRSK